MFDREQKLGMLTANIYLFKVNNNNTRKRCKLCSKHQNHVNVKALYPCHHLTYQYDMLFSNPGVFIVNFKYNSLIAQMFQFLT